MKNAVKLQGWRVALSALAVSCAAAEADRPLFERDIQPIFAAHCMNCHGADARKAGLDLRTPPMIQRGGDNGPVLAKTAVDSKLYQKVTSGAMPPAGELRLQPAQVEIMRRWIDAGAPFSRSYGTLYKGEEGSVTDEDRKFWAFRKLETPQIPVPRNKKSVQSPFDAFLLAKLEEKKLSFAPRADPETLIRRAYFDLLGLPPSPRDIDAFLTDTKPGAFERVVDKLLSSEHFGERWGRHWLDVAGYADVYGIDSNPSDIRTGEGKWRYRDYVVRAFNHDKPYDQFLREQIAGDEMVDWRNAAELTPEMVERLEATGFLRTAADDTNNDALNSALIRYRVLYLTLQNMSNAVLGLTVNCAQCHTHKYDPIPQRDYYQMLALFTPAYNPQAWLQTKDRWLPDVSPLEKERIDRHNAELEEQAKPLRAQIAHTRKPYEDKLKGKKAEAVPADVRADLLAALASPAAQRTPVEQYLVRKFGRVATPSAKEVDATLSKDDVAAIATIEARIGDLDRRRQRYGKLQALYDTGAPMPTYLNRRGNHETPAAEVQPGFLSVLTEPGKPTVVPYKADGGSSGRRLAFSNWLTEPGTPASALVARVMVNRVWQHLFGAGIVDPPDNFGKAGSLPTHPELLEWMAGEFVRGGWRVKPLIRALMLSAAYQQASRRADTQMAETVDPGNHLLWRMRLRRLESEAIRDSILAVTGKLNPAVGGEPVGMEYRKDGRVLISEKGLKSPDAQWRRSLYLFTRRNYNLNLLSVFDQPLMDANCPQRTNSAVVLQSLTMLNDGFLLEQADELAGRVSKEAGTAAEARVTLAFRLTLGRKPTGEEARDSFAAMRRLIDHFRSAGEDAQSAERKALAAFCHSLLNTSAFLYIG